jgi:regulator of protease activity HflC (stomatin/prohibitin superfamily)
MFDLAFQSIVIVLAVIVGFWFLLGFYKLNPQQSALLRFFGKPTSAKDDAGLHWRPFGFVGVTKISNAIQEFSFKETVLTKQEVEVASPNATPSAVATGDGTVAALPTSKQTAMAEVTVEGVVQFYVMSGMDNLVNARFKLANPGEMIKQRFQNALRAKFNTMTMWDSLSDKDQAARAIQEDLSHVTVEFGHTIANISVTRVTPADAIVNSNNAMIASVAEMQTRANKGRGEQLETVAVSKGRADAMIENGRGVAGQRDKIAEGMQGAVERLSKAIPGAQPQDLMAMVMYTVYTDMMQRLAADGQTKVIFVDNSPSAPANVVRELRQAIVSGNEVTAPATKPANNAASVPL